MKFFDFEKHIQQTLSNQQTDVDTNKLIDSLLDNKNNKRRIIPFWWIFAGVSIGMGGLVALSTWYPDQKVFQKDKEVIVDPSNNTSVTSASVSSAFSKKKKVKNVQSATNLAERKKTTTKLLSNQGTIQLTQNSVKNSFENFLLSESQTNEETVKNKSSFFSATRVHYEPQTLKGGYVLIPFAMNFFFPDQRTVECPSFSIRKKISFFMMPETGISFPVKTLVERIPDISEVTSFRRENEKTLEGLHGALYFGMYLGKSSFYVKSGLSYSRLAEKLDLVYKHTRLDTTYGIVSITKSQNGDTITVIYGDIITENTTKGQTIKHHYFHVLDIPLCLGYQFCLGSKWSLGVEAGLILNIGLRTEGQVLNTLHDFKPIEKSNYQKTLGLGYRAGLEVEYALTPNVGIGLNSRLTGYNKPFTSQHSNFKQNYLIPGLHLYGKYYFSN